MASIIHKSVPLPVGIEITERSRKFYDGTYKWDSEGFVDEDGVYRQFEFCDPIARAPSPLPPMLLSDAEDESLDKEAAINQHLLPGLVSSDARVPEACFTSAKQDKSAGAIVDILKSPDDPNVFVFASNSKDKKHSITVRRDDLFCDDVNREHLVGKFEGIFIACRYAGKGLSLEECYQLCGVSPPNGKSEEVANKKLIPPKSSKMDEKVAEEHAENTEYLPVASSPSRDADAMMAMTLHNKGTALSPVNTPPIHQGFSSMSDLSDPPSDISEWDIGVQEMEQEIVKPTKIKGRKKDSSGDEYEPLRKVVTKMTTNTRGVAQKIVRKKPRQTKATPNRVPPVLSPLQAGSYMKTAVRSRKSGENSAVGTASQRKSTRLSRGRANK